MNERKRSVAKKKPVLTKQGFRGMILKNGAPNGTYIEPSIWEDLADWEAQLKPFRDDILRITGGNDE